MRLRFASSKPTQNETPRKSFSGEKSPGGLATSSLFEAEL
jgi:hypothetical protein